MNDFFSSPGIMRLEERLTPKEKERRKVNEIYEASMRKLKENIEKKDIDATPSLQGSVAKDTWLSGEIVNLDIFVSFPERYSEEEMKRLGLEVGRLYRHKIAYAEHPYVKNFFKDTTIDVVPCFSAGRIMTSVDRTPLHTAYVKKRLSEAQKGHVRLLKKFMKAQNVYGAEQKVGGFSGYLCELLILHYGSLRKTLEAASSWKRGERIDMEGTSQRIFPEPLAVIDPTDPERNVAAAVVPKRLSDFILCSRLILEKPSLAFFRPKKILYKPNPGTKMFILEFETDLIDDILFPQLRKTERFMTTSLERAGFSVYESRVFRSGIFFELDVFSLPKLERRMGPPIFDRENCARFLQKHRHAFTQDLNLASEIERRHRDASSLLREIVSGKEGFGKTLKESRCRLYETRKAPTQELF